MKRIYFFSRALFFSLLLIFVVLFAASADDEAEVWSNIYKRASNIYQKHEILLNMAELDNRDLIPVYIDALEELIQWVGRSITQKEAITREEAKLLVVQKLGELEAADAAPLLYKVVDETDESFLKSESLIALGKTGDKTYAPFIARILQALNLYRGKKAYDEDLIAFGCISALEALKDPLGYKPVFYAAIGGYAKRVLDAAENALLTITVDPTPELKEIVTNESIIRIKSLALDTSIQSTAPESGKLEVGIEALYQGLTVNPQNIIEKTALMEMRKKSLLLLRDLQIASDAAVFLIDKVLYLDTDINEKLFAIEALAAFGNRNSADSLTRFLTAQNNRRGEDLPTESDRVLITVIQALEQIGDRIAYEELVRTRFAGHSYDVEQAVKKALEVFY